jgi:predicted HTH domain antitoxin
MVLDMSWAVEELIKLSEIQPEMVENTLEDVWKAKPDIYKTVVIGAYLDEKISLGKTAELLGITRIELQREMEEKGIPIRVLSSKDVVAEVEALKKWK